jgi:hypothetical protein
VFIIRVHEITYLLLNTNLEMRTHCRMTNAIHLYLWTLFVTPVILE